ncbi:unnamed protein product [Coffea canephora]|uniref:Uncharacterized protein n=1 Tax=Coffea canephora TaxID=49390 RepID=A0A068UTS7_COFCA|nr:unnamed protein product [Coffea canephora]
MDTQGSTCTGRWAEAEGASSLHATSWIFPLDNVVNGQVFALSAVVAFNFLIVHAMMKSEKQIICSIFALPHTAPSKCPLQRLN